MVLVHHEGELFRMHEGHIWEKSETENENGRKKLFHAAILFSSSDVPGSYELIDETIDHTSIRRREFFSATTLEVIAHELAIRALHESDRRIDLVGNVGAIRSILGHLDHFLEGSSCLSEASEDFFSVMGHEKNIMIGVFRSRRRDSSEPS